MAIGSPTRIEPQPGPQTAFLSSPADIVIYGGAAGGGKTFGLLLEPLRHVHNGNFGGVIFRRTSPQIRNEGGLWDTAMQVYPHVGAGPKETVLEWDFPSGARLKFAHLQYETDKLAWQGSQIAFLGWDELTHFSETQFWYLLSRNRSTCGVRPYVRATCNADADSWVAGLIAWWIDQETGLPIPERTGVVRWFVRVAGRIEWGDSREDLAARFGGQVQHLEPKSLTFIPASVHDNKILLEANPEYLASLLALPPVDQERLLDGNWKVRPSAGKVFNRAWFEVVDAAPAQGRVVRFWDFAATEKKLKGDDPDSTCGVRMRLHDGTYYVEDVITVQAGPAEVDRLVDATAEHDGPGVVLRWEEEGGSAGKRVSHTMVRRLAGYDVAGVRAQGDKIQRAGPFAAQAKAGNVKLVRGPWNDRYLTVLHHQPDWPHDDEMDASSGAFRVLTKPGYRPL